MKRRISIEKRLAVPQSFVTKGKQRLKQHVDTVYLKNGDEFEVELYNPTQNKVLAKIEMNGNSIGSGIIIRPGERVFLERYFDEAKKFLFETYTVDGDNKEVENSISKNGDVVVKFYNEYIQPVIFNNSVWSTTNSGVDVYYNSSFTTTCENNLNYPLTNKVNDVKKRKIETGRVEKGSDSEQSFVYDNSDFYTFPCTTNWWKIKPTSEKLLEKEDLKTYCTECGVRRKKDTHKFCPHCGTKF